MHSRIPQLLASIVVASLLLVWSQTLHAHDYWMLPSTSVVAASNLATDVSVSLEVGEDFVSVEQKPFEADRTSRFTLHRRAGSMDLMKSLADGARAIVHLTIRDPGGHLAVLDRNVVHIEIPADDFEKYLRHEGLSGALEDRSRRGESSRPGRERYTRCLKALVQVGDVRDRTFGLETNQSLELIPIDDPAFVAPGGSLHLLVKYRGKPLGGARLEAFSRSEGGVGAASYTTDGSGRAAILIDRRATWLIRMVHMVRCQGCPDAEWESTWSSYLFATADGAGKAAVARPALAALPRHSRRRSTIGLAVVLGLLTIAASAVLMRQRPSTAQW